MFRVLDEERAGPHIEEMRSNLQHRRVNVAVLDSEIKNPPGPRTDPSFQTYRPNRRNPGNENTKERNAPLFLMMYASPEAARPEELSFIWSHALVLVLVLALWPRSRSQVA